MSFFHYPETFLIGGTLQKGDSAEQHTVIDKYSGARLSAFPLASAAQVEACIRAASDAAAEMTSLDAGSRSKILHTLAGKLESQGEAFIRIIVAEAGKPLDFAKMEWERGVLTLRFAAEEALRIAGETVPLGYGTAKDRKAYTLPVPVGPVSCITPFNFPLNLALHKVAPAIAAGCPFVLKVPPQAPLTMMYFAQLLAESGLPKGAASVLLCSNADAEPLVKDERIRLLSFTGSDRVGWKLKEIAGKKKTVLELGGNAACIVDGSADLAFAARQCVTAAFAYSGQVCISTQRIYVLKDAFDAFLALFLKEVAAIRSGDPAQAGVLNGPMIDRANTERLKLWVDEALAGGAKLLAGGDILDAQHNLFQPTVLTGTQRGMKVLDEEVFGPLVVIESASTDAEAIQRVNESRFGLQAAVYSQRFSFIQACIRGIETGGIIVNGPTTFRADSMPYGGVKDSGTGKEGVRYAIRDMTEEKLVVY